MTVDAAVGPAEADVSRLLRRQLIVTGLGVAVVLIVVAFTRSQDVPAASRPVDVYVQAHLPPDPGSLRLAYLQLITAAVAAVLALGHAAHVAAFVFRRKAL
jgi:hypothetical protein